MKDQLFRIKPELQFVNEFIKIYGLNDITDTNLFTKQNLVDLNTIDEINNLLPELNKYYLPCKSKQFFSNIDEKKKSIMF